METFWGPEMATSEARNNLMGSLSQPSSWVPVKIQPFYKLTESSWQQKGNTKALIATKLQQNFSAKLRIKDGDNTVQYLYCNGPIYIYCNAESVELYSGTENKFGVRMAYCILKKKPPPPQKKKF